jgi:hypothetical protein
MLKIALRFFLWATNVGQFESVLLPVYGSRWFLLISTVNVGQFESFLLPGYGLRWFLLNNTVDDEVSLVLLGWSCNTKSSF